MFCAQLKKDFEGAGLVMPFDPGALQPTGLRQQILEAVVQLSEGSGDNLRRLLYRVDISEKQLGAFHRRHHGVSFEEVVTELIVRRTLQKVVLRKRFSNG